MSVCITQIIGQNCGITDDRQHQIDCTNATFCSMTSGAVGFDNVPEYTLQRICCREKITRARRHFHWFQTNKISCCFYLLQASRSPNRKYHHGCRTWSLNITSFANLKTRCPHALENCKVLPVQDLVPGKFRLILRCRALYHFPNEDIVCRIGRLHLDLYNPDRDKTPYRMLHPQGGILSPHA